MQQRVWYIISDRVRVNRFDDKSSRDDSKVIVSTLKTKLKIMLVHLEMRGILAPKNTDKCTVILIGMGSKRDSTWGR